MKNPQVLVQVKGLGEFTLELDPRAAPKTVPHFLSLVDSGFYNGTRFHQISPSHRIAAGKQTAKGEYKRLHKNIDNEAHNGLKNARYTVAMGRAVPKDSIHSEFFINTRDNPHHDHRDASHEGYGCPVFGRVVRGFDVVDKIASQRRLSKLFLEEVPAEVIEIERVVQLVH